MNVYAVVLVLLPTIWIVGGPNANFADLPQAVAAAASGDTILVNPGNYTPFTVTGKALTIRGAGAGATVVNLPIAPGSGYSNPQIASVPAGATFYVSGLAFAQTVPSSPPGGFAFPTAGLRISGAGGRVVLSDVTIQGAYLGSVLTNPPPPVIHGLGVEWGAEVHLSRCTITGGGANYLNAGAGAVVQNAKLAAEATSFSGGVSLNSSGGPGLAITGLTPNIAIATLARCSIHAGAGLYYTSTPGLTIQASMVRIAGTAADVIQGWTGAGSSTTGWAILVGAGPVASSVFLHGPVSLGSVGFTGAPVTIGPLLTGMTGLPYLSLAGTPGPGGELSATQPVTVSIDGLNPSAPYVLGVAGTCGFAFGYPSPFLGDALLPVLPPVMLSGTLDALGMAQIVATPSVSVPAIVGIPIYLQCAVFNPGGQVLLSNGDVRLFL